MSETTATVLQWETDVRLMTHPLMLGNFAKLIVITGLIIAALMSGLLAVTDAADAILPLLAMMGMILAGFAVLYLLVALLFFGNRMRMRFRVDGEAADAVGIDKRAGAANKVAIVAGIVGGKLGVTGAGILAETNKEQRIVWNAVAKVRYYPAWNAVALGNSWRTLVTLYCTPENYAEVAAAVGAALEARPAEAKAARKSPLPKLLLHTLATILAATPLFVLPDLDEAAILPALLTLAFALASLWLIPLFGWVVFGCLGWLAVLEVIEQSSMRTSMFDGSHYSGWSVLSGDDQAGFVLAVLGGAYLVWLSIGLLRGRIRSGFIGDMIEAGGE